MNTRDRLPDVAPVEGKSVEALIADIAVSVDERLAEIKALNKYIMRLETSVMLACAYLRDSRDVRGALGALDYALRMKHGPKTGG